MKSFPKFTTALCLALLLSAFTMGAAFGQTPSNDACSNAILLQPGDVVGGSTVGATAINTAFCGAGVSSPAVWYKMIGNGGPLTVSLCGAANFDSKISVYTGNCSSLECVSGNDDFPGCSNFTSKLTFSSDLNVEYYIMIHAFGTSVGSFTVSAWAPNVSVPNDDCSNATAVVAGTSGTVVSGSTIGATVDNVPAINGVSVTAPGVWYNVAGTGGKIRISTCGTPALDTRLSVYTGTCSNMVGLDANDDFCGSQSRLTINSQLGVTYRVLVHSFGGGVGDFDLNVLAMVPPPNDMPQNAITFTPGATAISFTNVNATPDANEVTPGSGSNPGSCRRQDGWCSFETNIQNSVWYKFVAPATGTVSILADGFDNQMALYSVGNVNDYATYQMIAANDDGALLLGGSSLNASGIDEASCLTPGQTYYVQIDGFNGAEGQGTFEVTIEGTAPLSVDAGDCQTLFVGYASQSTDTLYLNATVSGGFAPYELVWGSDPTIIYENTDYDGIAVMPNQSTVYTVTVTDAKGCIATDLVTVDVEDVATCSYAPAVGAYTTQTQTAWGGSVRTPAGNYRRNNFTAAFPNGLNINCGSGFNLTLTSSNAVEDFLPSAGPSAPLRQNYNNPTSRGRSALSNDLAGQTVALALTLGFDQHDQNFSTCNAKLADLIIATGPFANSKVSDLFTLAQKALGGCQTAYNPALIADALADVNANFAAGSVANGMLVEPGINLCNGNNNVCVAQYDVPSYLGQGYLLGSCATTCRGSNPAFPPPPPCFNWRLTIYGDVFSDLENSWSLKDLTTGTLVASENSVASLQTTIFDFCLDSTHCYEWSIVDMLGDGFNYGGNYSISYLGQNVSSTFQDPNNPNNPRYLEKHYFGVCGNKANTIEDEYLDHNLVAYPNPFTDQAFIDFQLEETSEVTLEIYSITGQKVATLFNGVAEANIPYTTSFSGTNRQSGLYFYKLRTDKGFTREGKLVLQK